MTLKSKQAHIERPLNDVKHSTLKISVNGTIYRKSMLYIAIGLVRSNDPINTLYICSLLGTVYKDLLTQTSSVELSTQKSQSSNVKMNRQP